MPGLELPRRHLAALQDVATRLLDHRKPGTPNTAVAHELLAGFHDACMRAGLDGLLAAIETAIPGVDVSDRTAFFDGPLTPALVTQLDAIDLDDGSPRNTKPGKLVTAVTSALGLTVIDDPDRTIALDGSLRAAAAAAISPVIEAAFVLPGLRDRIIAQGRAHCEERYILAYDKLAAQLDERGMKLVKIPKLPVDAVHAVERLLYDARVAVLGAAASEAIDRVKELIAAVTPEAAARIDAPITLRLTPRDVAIARVTDSRSVKLPAVVSASLLDSIVELASLGWKVPEQVARTYGASQKFAVGELVDHPKFGRGSVVAVQGQRVDIEFADGKKSLVHAK